MRPDQERVRSLLLDTVSLLVRNGLTYEDEIRIEGVIAITVDQRDIFVVHIDDKYGEVVSDTDSVAGKEKTADHNYGTKSQKRRVDNKTENRERIKRRKILKHTHSHNVGSSRQEDKSEKDNAIHLKIEDDGEDVVLVESGETEQSLIHGQPDDMAAMNAGYQMLELTVQSEEDGSSQLNEMTDTSGSGVGNVSGADGLNITGFVQNIHQQVQYDSSGTDRNVQPGCSTWTPQVAGQTPDMVSMGYPGQRVNSRACYKLSRKAVWVLNVWKTWASRYSLQNSEDVPKLTDMSLEQLGKYMTLFIKNVCKHDRSPYPPRTLYNICYELKRYLTENGSPVDFFMFKPKDTHFLEFRRALLQRFESLFEQGYTFSDTPLASMHALRREFS